jgi:putative ABC transport system permease protein
MATLDAWLADARRDTAYALRSLTRSRAFAITAILTLGIGIGATTAMYSVVDRVLLQPLPLPGADRLVQIAENERPRTTPAVNNHEYLEWRSRMTTLSGLATATMSPRAMVRTPAGLVRLTGGWVSTNYFEVLGARAMLGRTLIPGDDANPDVMVLGFYAWQRHFRSDRGVIGSVVELRSGGGAARSMTIVGVMPESMETIGAPLDIYTPLVTAPGRLIALGPMIGRLRDGVSLAAASEEAERIGTALRPARPASAPPLTRARFEARLLKDDIVQTLRPSLRIFLSAVAVVLTIVCANVANLLLARGTGRRRELATRLALGASRGRLIRQVLAECVVLAAAGAVVGAALGAAGVSLVKRLATVDAQGVFRIVFGSNILPRASEVGIDVRLFGVTLAISAVATLLFGLLPAVHLSRASPLQAIGSRGGGLARGNTRTGTLLVALQLAMATVLLVGAALLAKSFTRLATVEKGYDPAQVLAFQLVIPSEYPTARKAQTIEALLRELRALPGVKAAGFAYAGIMVGVQDTVGSFVPPGQTLDAVSQDPDRPRLKSLSAGYLDTAGVQLLAGRLLTESDSADAAPVAVINETIRRRYFGAVSPVGASMIWHGRSGAPVPVQIVGVIADVRQSSLQREPYAEVFMEYRQVMALQERWGATPGVIEHLAFGFMSFALRTSGDPASAIPAVRQAIARVDANAGLDAIMPLQHLVANSVARQRFSAVLLGIFAGVAALLSLIGIYGVIAYTVVQRTQEIGVRMALGAGRREVLLLVLGRGLWSAAAGIGLGLAGAAAATRYLQSMLYGITPLDAGAFVVVAATFAAVAALASYLPARRATQVDPMSALREQ